MADYEPAHRARLHLPRDALAAALADLSTTYLELGRFEDAEAALSEGMELEKALNRPRGIAFNHLGFGNLHLAQGDIEQARNEFLSVLEVAGEDHGVSLIYGALVGLAVIQAKSGDTHKASIILSAINGWDDCGPETRQQIETWAYRMDLNLKAAIGDEELNVEGILAEFNLSLA